MLRFLSYPQNSNCLLKKENTSYAMPSWLRSLQDRHSLIDYELDYEQDYIQAATGNRATVQGGACRLAITGNSNESDLPRGLIDYRVRSLFIKLQSNSTTMTNVQGRKLNDAENHDIPYEQIVVHTKMEYCSPKFCMNPSNRSVQIHFFFPENNNVDQYVLYINRTLLSNPSTIPS